MTHMYTTSYLPKVSNMRDRTTTSTIAYYYFIDKKTLSQRRDIQLH